MLHTEASDVGILSKRIIIFLHVVYADFPNNGTNAVARHVSFA